MQFLASVAATLVAAGVLAFMTWLVKSLRQFKAMDSHIGQLITQQKITNELLGQALTRLDVHEHRLDNHDDIIRRLRERKENDN